jgi:Fe2+ or Zn2+ uptake regulation protein
MPTPTDQHLDAELGTLLRERGLRVTLPRLVVHRHVRRAQAHVTPEQVHSQLARVHPGLSPATIYSTLDLLDELGLVRRVSTPRGHTVYDARTEPHHHLVCRRCGRVEDVDGAVEADEVEAAARAAGFRPERAEVQLSGLCRECAA